MKLIWHIVKKDLRALRWPLVVWAALIAAKLAMGMMLLRSDTTADKELFDTLDSLAKLLAASECLGIVLVAALIQEDMLVGTTAFWVTRPISGPRLLAAKLLGLGLIFVVLPILVTLPWWLVCHFDLATMAWAALETAGLHLLVVALGLLVAVVTDGLGRFFLWVLGMLAAVPLLAAIVAYTLKRWNAVVPSDLATTRFACCAAVALLGVAVVVGHQFLTRRTWRSVGLIGATLLALALVALTWPVSLPVETHWKRFLAERAARNWAVGEDKPAEITFAVERAEIRTRADNRRDRAAQLWVYGHVAGVPGNQMLVPAINSYTLAWADGATDEGWSWFNFDRRGPTLPTGSGEAGAGNGPSQPAEFRVIQTIPVAIATRLQREPAAYSLKAHFSLVESRTKAQVPLAPGEWIVEGMFGERVAGVEKEGEQLSATLVRHRPGLVGDYLNELADFGRGLPGWGTSTQYLLMNREGKMLDAGMDNTLWTSRVAGVEVSWETKTFRAMARSDSAKPRWEAIKALDEAELIRVTYRPRGHFVQEFKVAPLVAQPARL